eukprot:TRINITY_DN2835_c0_g1_i1.p1 TRINITY_DN2835_c0_g1~~TRINITY_DN2835_c0_g1_i1.p1  ORF type:complete len:248 (-),score=80.15 TRINITY_DN2835_c0_g1_i1:158-901(-)
MGCGASQQQQHRKDQDGGQPPPPPPIHVDKDHAPPSSDEHKNPRASAYVADKISKTGPEVGDIERSDADEEMYMSGAHPTLSEIYYTWNGPEGGTTSSTKRRRRKHIPSFTTGPDLGIPLEKPEATPVETEDMIAFENLTAFPLNIEVVDVHRNRWNETLIPRKLKRLPLVATEVRKVQYTQGRHRVVEKGEWIAAHGRTSVIRKTRSRNHLSVVRKKKKEDGTEEEEPESLILSFDHTQMDRRMSK